MADWVLILTVFFGSNGGVAIHHIDFADESACFAAAKEWRKYTAPEMYSARFMERSAVCVRRAADGDAA